MQLTARIVTDEAGRHVQTEVSLHIDRSYLGISGGVNYNPLTDRYGHKVISSTREKRFIWPEELSTWLSNR